MVSVIHSSSDHNTEGVLRLWTHALNVRLACISSISRSRADSRHLSPRGRLSSDLVNVLELELTRVSMAFMCCMQCILTCKCSQSVVWRVAGDN